MIPAERAHLNVAAASHPGMSGKNNEDRYGVSAYFVDGDVSRPSVLAIVADGIGGHRAGEVASELAVEIISQSIAESDARLPVQSLQNAIIRASQFIHQKAEADPALKGMGSTCACVWVIDDHLYTASVGDSRVYLIRGSAIHQITTDHTWVQEAVENGTLSADEARSHPNAHVIRRYLGSRNEVVPDVRLRLHPGEGDRHAESNQGVRLLPGDTVVLCSDGLTDLVDDSEILTYLKNADQQEALDKLVDLANQRGGHDNITVVALQVPLAERVPVPAGAPGRRWPVRLGCAVIGVLLFVAALVLGGGAVWLFLPGTTPSPTATSGLDTLATAIPQTTATFSTTDQPTTGPRPSISPTAAPTETPRRLPGGSSTRSPATLTPWPTNTRAP